MQTALFDTNQPFNPIDLSLWLRARDECFVCSTRVTTQGIREVSLSALSRFQQIEQKIHEYAVYAQQRDMAALHITRRS